MRRFERIYDVVEPIEEYRRGGYHPVHLCDIFKGRYRIEAKLSYGQFSTVWLAYDEQGSREVALKILKAECSSSSEELENLLRISQLPADYPGKKNLLELLDHFYHHGPNGDHLCLVFPVIISDGMVIATRRKPQKAALVRTVSAKVLQGLDLLHSLGLVHSDLQPANLLISRTNLMSFTPHLNQPEKSRVRWLDERAADGSAPQYLSLSQRPRGFLDNVDPLEIIVMIGDVGAAHSPKEKRKHLATPLGLRAPEIIEDAPYDEKIDVFALGCCKLFQIATNESLFSSGSLSTKKEAYEAHCQLLQEIIDEKSDERFIGELKEKLPGFADEEARRFGSFLRLMLRRDPNARPTPKDLLKNSWILG